MRKRTRKELIAGATAGAVAVGAAAYGIDHALGHGGAHHRAAEQLPIPDVTPGSQPAGLPARQHAWADYTARDAHGLAVAPKFDRLLLFDVRGTPTNAYMRVLEAALRTLERAYPWRHDGLLFTVGWGHDYFANVVRQPAPIPAGEALADFENPQIDDYHVVVHCASDDEQRLAQVEAALTRGAALAGSSGPLDLRPVLAHRETRTGFAGTGIPASRQDVSGIPTGNPVPRDSPLFMGFRSGLRKNQATEDAVTIASGAFAGGTTMHVSHMRLRLDSWYDALTEDERAARMYGPEVSAKQAQGLFVDAASDPQALSKDAARYGVVGHAQTSATARKGGKPRILRRDFDTTDGGEAGLHFVSIQRTIADFVQTRKAMNASNVQLLNPGISDTQNNGINEFIFVTRRANYIVPPRAMRSFPLVT